MKGRVARWLAGAWGWVTAPWWYVRMWREACAEEEASRMGWEG